MELKDRIAGIRKYKGLTQAELANKIGMTTRAIQNYESGNRIPKSAVLEKIAEGLEISIEKVYEVVTFYAQFALNPKGKYNISVCLGTACYVKGSGDIFDRLSEVLKIGEGECTPDGKFSLESCRCVGACGLAPVLLVNEDVYGRLVADDVPGVLAKYSE